jgi:Raf kinase inhibitor-like YbhB/YbcL family protein
MQSLHFPDAEMRLYSSMIRQLLILSACIPNAHLTTAMELTSTAFKNDGVIPAGHSYHGRNTSPPLTIGGVPDGAASLALICDDPDAPAGTWVHWVVWNLDPKTQQIPQGALPAGAIVGKSSWGKTEWGGPAPPSGTHHYVFKLYALKEPVHLKPGADANALTAAMKGKILAEARLVGLYSAAR